MAGIFDSMNSGMSTSDSEIPFALRLMMVGNALQGFGGRGGGGNANASIIQSIMAQRQTSAAEAKKRKAIENYAASIDDPKRRDAILSGLVDPSEYLKQDFELQKQQAGADQALSLEKWKHDNDPNNKLFEQLFGGAGASSPGGGPTGEAQGPVAPGGAGPEVLAPGATGVADPVLQRARKAFNAPDMTRMEAIAAMSAAANKGLPAAINEFQKSRIEASKAAQEGVAKGIVDNTTKEEFAAVSGAIGSPPKSGAPKSDWDAYAQAVTDYAGFPVSAAQAKAFSAYRSLEKRDAYLNDIKPKASAVTVNNVLPGTPAAASTWVVAKTETDGSITYQDTTKDPTAPGAFKTIRPEGSKSAAEAADNAKMEEARGNSSMTGRLQRVKDVDRLVELAKEAPDAFGVAAQTGAANLMPGVRNAYIEKKALLGSLASKISIEELQKMREASKTGGAVGQVTEGEWAKLASVQTALAGEDGQNMDAPTFAKYAQKYRAELYDVVNGTNYSGNYPQFDKHMPKSGPESGMKVGPDGSVKTPPLAIEDIMKKYGG